ncbi:MAG: hypothetical protein GF388_10650 [Candidatus Aegiribacteria sp.]|nr:hypothetical protein [Candidatus Aegiribacteria sp.]MBD3295475.1 hypothetical protein [Candidatus Fermentibacteria bacterium]
MRELILISVMVPSALMGFQMPYQNPFLEYPFETSHTDDDVIIIVIDEGDPISWEYGIPCGYANMRALWESICSEDAHFTIRSGEEYLIYSQHTLVYRKDDARSTIPINPEELWTIMSHYYRPISPATGQISIQGWFPGMEDTETDFITSGDPAMTVVQEFLDRGREAAQ